MEALFGLPAPLLARLLAVVTIVALLVLAALASRRRTLLKIGVRNAARRPLRSAVIVVGLALSTVVIATAFTTGDAMTSTIRALVTGSMGQVDEVVTTSPTDFTQLSRRDAGSLASGKGLTPADVGYFPLAQYLALRAAAEGSHAIAGLMPAITAQAPVADEQAQLAHPNVGLLALPPEQIAGMPPLRGEQGGTSAIATLGDGEVYLNRAAADLLSTGTGRRLRIYLPPAGSADGTPPVANTVTVRGVVQNAGLAGPQPTVFLPLSALQALAGRPGQVNEILVENRCHDDSGACSRRAALDLRKALMSRDAAETVREALASSPGRSVLAGLQARRSGRGKDQVADLARTVAQGRVTDHLIYLLGDPQIAGTLRATASFLPTRQGGRAGRVLRELNPLTVIEVRQSALNEASDYGSILTNIFLVLGLFSIVASLLLVFLVFVMLAAERRGEMGIARAIGLRRTHLVQSFAFEGMLYDLGAAALGLVAGIAVSAGIVGLVARALTSYGIPVQRNVEPRSLVIAFCAGLLITFATVVFSAWKVSRLNIVEAIRGIAGQPELGEGLAAAARKRLAAAAAGAQALSVGRVRQAGTALWHAAAGVAVLAWMVSARGVLPVVVGFLLFSSGRSHQRYIPFALGVSLLVIGGALLLRWLLLLARLPAAPVERASYTLAGAGLAAFWAFPPPFWRGARGQYAITSVETFALAGVMMVLGTVWLAAYNLGGPLQLLLRLFARGGAVAAAVKMAVAYPLQNRFRTGIAIAMFSLVIFTMAAAAVLLDSAHNAYLARERPPTGYDIVATAPVKAQINDVRAALDQAAASRPDEFAGVGSLAAATAQAVEPGAAKASWNQVSLHLADPGMLTSTRPRLSGRAAGYASDAAVWDALASRPGMAVVARGSLASGDSLTAMLSRVHRDDTTFQPDTVWLRDNGGAPLRLTVIGIVDDRNALPSGLLTRSDNVPFAAASATPTTFLFKTAPSRDPAQAATGLDLSFGLQGLQTQVVGEELRNVQTVRSLLNYLLEGFVGLGLVSGMAALAVISTRTVVERRQQIGMLRAIGLKRSMVQLSFLLEVSFVALLSIIVGITLGLLLSRNVVAFLSPNFAELRLTVPWGEVLLIAAIAYAASVVATLAGVWQAGRVSPADALRYE